MPIALVGVAFALAWAIITEASIGFLGFGDPSVVSWGSIVYDAYASQMMYRAPVVGRAARHRHHDPRLGRLLRRQGL